MGTTGGVVALLVPVGWIRYELDDGEQQRSWVHEEADNGSRVVRWILRW